MMAQYSTNIIASHYILIVVAFKKDNYIIIKTRIVINYHFKIFNLVQHRKYFIMGNFDPYYFFNIFFYSLLSR